MLSRIDRINATAEAIALHLFIAMLNPKFRGPNFDYKIFNIAHHIEAVIFTSLPWNITNKEKKQAGKFAKNKWKEWLKLAGEWLPKPTEYSKHRR